MVYGIYASLILLALLGRKSKFAYLLLFVFAVLLCAYCTDSFDINNVRLMFEYPETVHEDVAVGWDFFFRACIRSGMTFTLYKGICAFITLSFVTLTIRRMTKNCSLVFGLYVLCLLPSQITQIRFSMAIAIAMFAVTLLIQKKPLATLEFLLVMVFAILIHYSVAFYLLLILLKRVNGKKLFKHTVLITFALLILLYTNALYLVFTYLFPNQQRLAAYLNTAGVIASINEHSIITILLTIARHLICFILFCIVYFDTLKLLKKKPELLDAKDKLDRKLLLDVDTLESMYHLQVMLLVLLPFYFISSTYFRLCKSMIIFIFILIGNYVSVSRMCGGRRYDAKFVVFTAVIFAAGIWLLEAYMSGEMFSTFNSFSLGAGD